MKILSRMLSKKIDPQAPVDLEQEDDGRAGLDDAGQVRTPRPRSVGMTDPIKAREEEPEVAGTGWAQDGDWDDDWDDDEDWGDDDDPVVAQERRRQTEDKEHLVSEIREAMTSVTHREPSQRNVSRPRSEHEISDEELAGRRKLARSQLTPADNETEDRLLEKTEDVMSERETSRRRSAMAHMKAAAAATKADRVLRHVAGRDSTADPEEQSPYREDLAKVVRPHSVGKPVSRPATRPEPVSPTWDRGEADEDAALFAASESGVEDDLAASVDQEMSAAEERRISRRPLSMNEDDFADPLPDHKPRAAHDFPSSRFAVPEDDGDEDKSAFDEFEDAAEDISRASRPSEDDYEDPFAGTQFASHEEEDEDDDFAPRPSRVVTQAVAFANASDDDDISLDDEPEPNTRKKIWEMADEVAAEIESAPPMPPGFDDPGGHEDAGASEAMLDVSGAVAGRAGRSAGRVKTRLLGFQADDEAKDVFAAKTGGPAPVVADKFPTGWIIVIDGPGRGASFSLHAGVSNIGRGEDQAVRLDFGDTSISRNNHAAVAFDEEQGQFFLGHGGKSNLVRLNGKPVLSTEEMANGDEIRIGETSLKFVALCGEDFSWTSDGDNGEDA